MLLENFKYKSQSGASFVEYAIALSALLAIFIVVNSFIKKSFEDRAKLVIDTSDDMSACESGGKIIAENPEACL
jgi:hypothetical protein